MAAQATNWRMRFHGLWPGAPFLKGALATAPLLLIDPARLWAQKQRQVDEDIGPSTTTEPHMIPTIDGVSVISDGW
jgi:hypothetical protein